MYKKNIFLFFLLASPISQGCLSSWDHLKLLCKCLLHLELFLGKSLKMLTKVFVLFLFICYTFYFTKKLPWFFMLNSILIGHATWLASSNLLVNHWKISWGNEIFLTHCEMNFIFFSWISLWNERCYQKYRNNYKFWCVLYLIPEWYFFWGARREVKWMSCLVDFLFNFLNGECCGILWEFQVIKKILKYLVFSVVTHVWIH